jgi:hypothetical protein
MIRTRALQLELAILRIVKSNLLSLFLLPSLSWAVTNITDGKATPSIPDGKLLYDESCAKCHHAPYESLGWNEITSKAELRQMIGSCSDHFQLEWNEQDITDTSEYLNTEFFFLTQ